MDCIVIGRNSHAKHNRCILIGDDLVSERPYHFIIRTQGIYIADTLSEAKWKNLHNAIQAIIQPLAQQYGGEHKQIG